MAEKEKKNMGMSESFKGRMLDFAPVINNSGAETTETDTDEDEE